MYDFHICTEQKVDTFEEKCIHIEKPFCSKFLKEITFIF